MHERIHIHALRTSDPLTAETLAAGAMRLPLGQLAERTLLDLLALSEIDGLSPMFRRDLAAFVIRMEREIADLPDGAVWSEFLAGYDDIQADQIPARFRAILTREAERETRVTLSRSDAASRLARWSETPPSAFVLPVKTGAVRQVIASRADADAEDGERRVSKRTPRKAPAADRKPALSTEALALRGWIRQSVLNRLRQYGEKGLAEVILLSGVQHDAATEHPNTPPQEIHAVLLELKKQSLIRLSAGRWRIVSRW